LQGCHFSNQFAGGDIAGAVVVRCYMAIA
jgi:hypothetical protein